MTETTIAKCGHEVEVIAPGTDCEDVPDCCAMCEEILDASPNAECFHGDAQSCTDGTYRSITCSDCGQRVCAGCGALR